MERVLLVEADPAVCCRLADALSDAGFQVDAVGGLGDARARLAVSDFELIVTGADLPDGRGAALGQDADRRGVPLLVVDPGADPERPGNGAIIPVGEPFNADAFLRVVHDVLGEAEPDDGRRYAGSLAG